MHTQIRMSDFNFADFQSAHSDDFVVIVSASWHQETQTGEFKYQTRLGDVYSPIRKGTIKPIGSSNRAMLKGVLAAITRIKLQNRRVFVLSPTPLGFKKRNGPNQDIVNQIFDACGQKNLDMHSITILKGKHLFLDLLDSNNIRPL